MDGTASPAYSVSMRYSIPRPRFHLIAALLGLCAAATPSLAADSAVVLLYPRLFAPGAAAESSGIRVGRLETHLAELKGGSYRVLGPSEIVAAFRENKALPDRTIALTFDDPSLVLYGDAWPRLKAAGLAFGVFVAPSEIGGAGMMNWTHLREMKAAGVTIGLRVPAAAAEPNSEQQGAAELNRAAEAFAAELGGRPGLLVWPAGEVNAKGMQAARNAGFAAAFGQHSGAAWMGQEHFYLPRFALTEDYADLERFRQVTAALPLPASDIIPANPRLEQNPPPFGFTLADDYPNLDQLACFTAHDGRMKVELLGNRVEARMSKPFPPGRGRINCTLPNGDGRWRWLGYQWSVRR